MFILHMYSVHASFLLNFVMVFINRMAITDRARLLLEMTSLEELAKPNSKEYIRWQNVKRGRARFGAVEIEELGRLMPQYRYWLISGEVMPEVGQTSPAYDEANKKLQSQSAG